MEWMGKCKTIRTYQLSGCGNVVKKNSVLLTKIWFWPTDKGGAGTFPILWLKNIWSHIHSLSIYNKYCLPNARLIAGSIRTKSTYLQRETASLLNTRHISIGKQHKRPVLESSTNVKWLCRAKNTEVLSKIKQNTFTLQIVESCRVSKESMTNVLLYVKVLGS